MWKAILLAAEQRIPMSTVLKDGKSGRCAADFVFPVQQVGLATDAEGRTLWLRLGVTPRGPGTTVDRIGRVPKFVAEWDFTEPATHPGTSPEAMEKEASKEGWPEDSIRYGAIKARQGQADFRARLLAAYGRKCCVSGCQVEALLEAAHIRPHAEEPNYDTRNGLLLRADLHTLYDLHLLGVDEFGAVHLSKEVADPYYRRLVAENACVTEPDRGADRPSEDDRRARMALFCS